MSALYNVNLARESGGEMWVYKAAPASLANVLLALKSRKIINHDADDVRNLKRETVEQGDKRKVSQNCIITVWESLSRMYKNRMMEWIRGMDGLRNRFIVVTDAAASTFP